MFTPCSCCGPLGKTPVAMDHPSAKPSRIPVLWELSSRNSLAEYTTLVSGLSACLCRRFSKCGGICVPALDGGNILKVAALLFASGEAVDSGCCSELEKSTARRPNALHTSLHSEPFVDNEQMITQKCNKVNFAQAEGRCTLIYAPILGHETNDRTPRTFAGAKGFGGSGPAAIKKIDQQMLLYFLGLE
jgi:hypothetical protein